MVASRPASASDSSDLLTPLIATFPGRWIGGACLILGPLLLRQGPPLSRRALNWSIGIIIFDIVLILLSLQFPSLMN